jgi:ATP-dependent Lon protease
MTGEITLRGKVLPVGGIKEKVLAARRAGIHTVALPRRNEHDLDDIPAELRNEMEIIFVDTVDDVLSQVLKSDGSRRLVEADSTPAAESGHRPAAQAAHSGSAG